ncbi:MAG: acyl-CoA desaturase [Cyanobacteria bacterium J06649_11]
MRQYSPLTIVSYTIGPILVVSCHFGSLLVFKTGLSWGAAAWILFLYLIRMLATTAIYHRLLTHKSYQAPAPVLWLGSIIAASAGHMGPSWWKAHHLTHHQHSDTQLDPHSPYRWSNAIQGFYWSQAGWLLSPEFFPDKLPKDVENDIVLKTIDRLHFVPVVALAALSYFIGGAEYLGAFFLSTTILYHCVQTVNSICHVAGEQPFITSESSRNNAFVAVLTLGEGWHNLHHAFQSSSRHGITIRSGEVAYLPDPTFSFIKMLEFFKLASKPKMIAETNLISRSREGNFQDSGLSAITETSIDY